MKWSLFGPMIAAIAIACMLAMICVVPVDAQVPKWQEVVIYAPTSVEGIQLVARLDGHNQLLKWSGGRDSMQKSYANRISLILC